MPEGARQQPRPLLHLGYEYQADGSHPAGWRYPGAERGHGHDPDYIARLARLAEDAGFDFFLLGDHLAAGAGSGDAGPPVAAATEAFTTAAYLATLTSRIGLVATADSAYCEPFNLARLTASLDHVSRGRAGWNVLAGSDPDAALNYSRPGQADERERYDRAHEFTGLVRALWDSWEDGAFVRNKETGEFVDGTRIHPVNHQGASFRVKGPLNVARPPQGHPVILHAAAGERSRDLAAREADVVLAGVATIRQGAEYAADIRSRAAAAGRDPAGLLVFAGLTPVVGRTLSDARARYDELNARIILDDDIRFGGRGPDFWTAAAAVGPDGPAGPGYRNLGALSRRIGLDVTAQLPDSVITGEAARAAGRQAAALIAAAAARTGRTPGRDLTWRDLLHTAIAGGHVVVGGPEEIADYLESWLDAGAAQGFVISPAYLPGQLAAFASHVVPELRRRGLLRPGYDGATLRDHLGLDRPQGRLAAQRASVAS